MSDYRRWFVPGGTYFFTVVTYGRKEILTSDLARPILRQAFLDTRKERPFRQLASVLLPDHLHLMWTMPPKDDNFGVRLKRIKEEFTRNWLFHGGSESVRTISQQKRGERGVWQPRFWEHTIRDEEDLEAHFDYIHWNPVKHGLVHDVRDWGWSTFHKYSKSGHYTAGWGSAEPTTYSTIEDFGEP